MPFRIAVDTGGTFTDAVVTDVRRGVLIGKALTSHERAFGGISEALVNVGAEAGLAVPEILARAEFLLYGTTRATNAVVQGRTARTAFFTTRGFPDILLLREGGKLEPFNFNMVYPDPYVARHLTYEIPERINAEGEVLLPLDEKQAVAAIDAAVATGVESIGVCLLWSILNPQHELRLSELIEERAPGVLYTLSHQLNPIIREYRRASSTVIDASLKPLMQAHLGELERDLREHGFAGTLFVATSFGGAWDVQQAIEKPIYTIGSGPSLTPTAALEHAGRDLPEQLGGDLIVCDAGGTTFDVALVSEGQVNRSPELWLGPRFTGHLLGISAVDIKSIGSGGGSVAWMDPGGLLRVGPQSAGARPGPVSYGFGGTEPTVTDAALVLGYIRPDRFLGGRMPLEIAAARSAIRRRIGEPLGLEDELAAAAILTVANEKMVAAIKEITIDQGVDPRAATIIAGGGAAGLNIVPIARELGCGRILLPKSAGVLSAYGGVVSDVIVERRAVRVLTSQDGALRRAASLLEELERELAASAADIHLTDGSPEIEFFVEARYPQQVWELSVPLNANRLASVDDVEELVKRFHEVHERVFAVRDDRSPIECVAWIGRLTLRRARHQNAPGRTGPSSAVEPVEVGPAHFLSFGTVDIPRYLGTNLVPGHEIAGPAVIEEPTTTIVVYPGADAHVLPSGNYLVRASNDV